MKNTYSKSDVRKIFNAGKNCALQHPDDNSYDKVHFDRIINKLNTNKLKKINNET